MAVERKSQIARIQQKQSQLRAQLWPDLNPNDVWDRRNRTKTKGFTTIPRTIPLIGAIMDSLSGKGKPVSTTYLEMWCRSNDDGFVILNKHREIAFSSGFSTERGVSTWKERVRKLEELNFISTKPGPSGDHSYAQIWNPYYVVKLHMLAKTPGFLEDRYNALLERVLEIGANDLLDES